MMDRRMKLEIGTAFCFLQRRQNQRCHGRLWQARPLSRVLEQPAVTGGSQLSPAAILSCQAVTTLCLLLKLCAEIRSLQILNHIFLLPQGMWNLAVLSAWIPRAVPGAALAAECAALPDPWITIRIMAHSCPVSQQLRLCPLCCNTAPFSPLEHCEITSFCSKKVFRNREEFGGSYSCKKN